MTAGAPFVLIMAGGTGGHIFPGLAVADSLRQRGVGVRWLGARGAMESRMVPAAGIALDVVDIAGLRGKGALRWLSGPWQLLRAVAQASKLLGRQRPACAISFGGYAAGPGGLAARLRRVPLLVHEQNRVPGLTNRVLARFASRVLEAFPGSWPTTRRPLACGNPVRSAVAELPAPELRLAGRSEPLRLLVTGGSQGARALNHGVPAALQAAALPQAMEVRHQCGRGQVEETEAAYQAAGFDLTDGGIGLCRSAPARDSAAGTPLPQDHTPSVQVTEFIEDMAEAYGWADVIVCRAGALTVSEVAAAGVAAVFVPFPHAVDDHQTRNAEFLVERGAALLVPEADIAGGRLAGDLKALLPDRLRQREMASRARAAAVPDAAERVATLCMEYVLANGPAGGAA